MNMYKEEKKILTNDHLENPDERVLDNARSAMPERKPRRRINVKHIIALASSCAVILVVILCIPFMMPAESGMQYVYNSELKVVPIESINSFNQNENLDILHLEPADDASAFFYEDNVVYIEETYTFGETSVKLLVKFDDNCKGLSFQKEEEYTEHMSEVTECIISDTSLLYAEQTDAVYVMFSVRNYSYFVSIFGETADWQNLISDLLN